MIAVLVILIAALALFKWFTSSAYLTARAQDLLRHYAGPDAQIGSVKAGGLHKVVVRDVNVPDLVTPSAPALLHADTVTLDCDLLSVLSKRFTVRSVTLTNPIVHWSPRAVAELQRRSAAQSGLKTNIPAVFVTGADISFDAGSLFGGSPALRLVDGTAAFETIGGSQSHMRATGSAKTDFGALLRFGLELDTARTEYRATAGMPGVPIDEHIKALLPEGGTAWWDRFAPKGAVDLNFSLARNWTAHTEEVKGGINLNDCQITLADFPIPITRLNGQINYEGNQIRASNISGRLLDGTIQLNKFRIVNPGPEAQIDVEVTAAGVSLTKPFSDALPPAFRAEYERYKPTGLADVACALTVFPTGRPPEFRITARLRDVDATTPYVTYPLTQINGTMTFDGKKITFSDCTGHASGGAVAFSGGVTLHPGGALVDLEIQGQHVGLSPELLQAFPPEVTAVFREYGVKGGSVDATYTFHRPPGANVVRAHHVMLTAANVAAQWKDFPYPVKSLSGKIEWWDGNLILSGIRALGPDGLSTVDVSGRILKAEKPERPNLLITARGLPLDDTLKAALSPMMQKQWEQFHPGGKINLSVALTIAPILTKMKDIAVEVECIDCKALYADVPYPVDEITGRVIYDGRRLTLRDIRGRGPGGKGQIILRGAVWPSGEPSALDLDVTVERLPVDETLIAALPPDLAAPARTLKIEGALSFHGVLQRGLTEGESVITVQDGALLQFPALAIRGWPVGEFTAIMALDPKTLKVSSFRGSSGAGQFDGAFSVGRGGEHAFSGAVACRKLNVAKLLQGMKLGENEVAGSLDGNVELRGRGPDRKSIQGSGHIEFSKGELKNVTLVRRIIDVVMTIVAPVTVPDHAVVDFNVKDEVVNLTNIELLGQLIPLHGTGTVGLDGRVDMTFVTAKETSWLLNKLPVIGEMLKSINDQLPDIQRHLVQVRVSGTLENPQATLVPLPPAVDLVKGFLDLFRSSNAPAAPNP